jgi:hypothetical protein
LRFGETARFAATAGLDTLTCFAGLACLDDLLCFEPLKRSDSHPAWLASIGSSTIAAMATMIVRRRGQNPEAILPRTQMHSRRFMAALPATIIAFDAAIPEGGRRCSVSGH